MIDHCKFEVGGILSNGHAEENHLNSGQQEQKQKLPERGTSAILNLPPNLKTASQAVRNGSSRLQVDSRNYRSSFTYAMFLHILIRFFMINAQIFDGEGTVIWQHPGETWSL